MTLKICVLDGQGGGIGTKLVSRIKEKLNDYDFELLALGTNVLATNAMIKAGAHKGATGENAIVFNCKKCDYILGPIGVILANGLLGEVSPKMAISVASSNAEKILIPSNVCGTHIVSVKKQTLDEYVVDAIALLKDKLC